MQNGAGIMLQMLLKAPDFKVGNAWQCFRRTPPSVMHNVVLLETSGSQNILPSCRQFLAKIESNIMRFCASSRHFLALTLPSSNGCYTARALAAMYGAISNQGRVKVDGQWHDGMTLHQMAPLLMSLRLTQTGTTLWQSARMRASPAVLVLGSQPRCWAMEGWVVPMPCATLERDTLWLC